MTLPKIDDPWYDGDKNRSPSIGIGKTSAVIDTDDTEYKSRTWQVIHEKYFDDDVDDEYLTIEYQMSSGIPAAKGDLIGIYRVHHPEIECERIQKVYAQEDLQQVLFEKVEGDVIRTGERVITLAANSSKDLSCLLRNETVKRMETEIYLDINALTTREGLEPTNTKLLEWYHEVGQEVQAGRIICSIEVHHCDDLDRIDVIADSDLILKEKVTPNNADIRQEIPLGIVWGECPVDQDFLCHFAWQQKNADSLSGESSIVRFGSLYDGNTHSKVLSISDSLANGIIAKGDELMRLECYENNDHSTVRSIAKITSKVDIKDIVMLVDKGSTLRVDDNLISAPVFESTTNIGDLLDVTILGMVYTYDSLYEGNTQCTVLTISDALTKGYVKEGEEIMRLGCFENNDTSKTQCIAKVVALVDIDGIIPLVEIDDVISVGHDLISAPIFAQLEASEAIHTDLNDGFARYAPLFDGNTHCKVLSISNSLAKGSAKKGVELMNMECYGDQNDSGIRFIGTLIALTDLESIDFVVEEGTILEPGDKVFFAPILEKIQASDAIRVDVNAFTAEGQKNVDIAVANFKEAKSFDASFVLNRLRQDKRLKLQNIREVSSKRNATISAGTALASVAATATGFGAVASVLTLLRIASQASQNNGEIDNDLEQGSQIAEEIRQLITNQRSRLGEAQGRFIGISADGEIKMYCVTQSAIRGLHLIELNYAGNTEYLESNAFRNCLASSFNDEELEEVWGMLLPTSTQAIRGIRLVSPTEALDNDKYYQVLSGVGSPYRVEQENNSRIYVYKLLIPHHSDF